jgi:pimeloyl-ACP methyl ester carboxylesterase
MSHWLLAVTVLAMVFPACAGRSSGTKDLAAQIAVPGIVEVCPESRNDQACRQLRVAHNSDPAVARVAMQAARAELLDFVAKRRRSGTADPWDPAIGFYARQRAMGLFAWHVVTNGDHTRPEPANYAQLAAAVLGHHFPAYPPGAFPTALHWAPPQPVEGCAEGEEYLLMMLPGVARTLTRRELETQAAVLREAFPCLRVERVDTRSFVPPEENVAAVRVAMTQYPNAKAYHLFGYSQGGLNALQALLDIPELAARARSVVLLNVPAQGSEVGEALYRFVDSWTWLDWIWPRRQPAPLDKLLSALIASNGSKEAWQTWLQHEGLGTDISPRELIRQRRAGIRSLGTSYAAEFWKAHGTRLPRTPIYLHLRSVITDRRNLPASNAALHTYLEQIDRSAPYNDMQVRLVSQRLGSPLNDEEVLSPVAEGNHWQWALVPDDIPSAVMPHEILRRTPQSAYLLAYYQALAEVGIFGP